MLPVVAGARETKKQMMAYTVVLWPFAVAPFLLGLTGIAYLGLAVVLSVLFTLAAWRVWTDEGELAAKRMFGFSILYLFLLFAGMLLDRAPGLLWGAL
jgi:protoheme IX farnesyltransferase